MSLRPPRAALLAALATVVGLTAAPASAKEDVEATLTTRVPLEAAAGDEITLAWRLTYETSQGKRRPFNAMGVFVELFSAGGGASTTGADSRAAHPTGEYEAVVVVPENGIGGIQIALMGWANGEPAPAVFPITNNPLPEVTPPEVFQAPSAQFNFVPGQFPSRIAPRTPESLPGTAATTSESDAVDPATWILVGLAALFALCAVAGFLRRRHRAATA